MISEKFLDEVSVVFGASVPNLVLAFGFLLLGWIFALALAGLVRKLVRKSGLDRRLSGLLADSEHPKSLKTEDVLSKGVYYLVMVFVLVGFFQSLGLTLLAQPLNTFLQELTEYAPRIVGAGDRKSTRLNSSHYS